jgi:glycosyltransferase involved in cell wall biosynthesis
MSSPRKPLLSICIPTYNRSKLLKINLLSILSQMAGLEEDVEVIVSDNSSTDDTPQVVEWARQFGAFRYHRQEKNIGGGPNFYYCSNQLAHGEYCWLIGDDDFVRKGAIERLVRLMKVHPEVDLFFTNLMHIDIEELGRYEEPVSSAQFRDDLKREGKNGKEQLLDSFDQLVDPKVSGVSMCALQTSIFRRDLWVEESKHVMTSDADFSNVQTTYPHAVILARTMRNRKVFYIGDPLLVVGDGARGWEKEYPAVHVIRAIELLDLFESLGMNPDLIHKAKASIIIEYTPYILALSFIKVGEGHKFIKYRESIAPYVGYKEFWMSFLLLPIFRLRYLL